jgi:hypothetical protein
LFIEEDDTNNINEPEAEPEPESTSRLPLSAMPEAVSEKRF